MFRKTLRQRESGGVGDGASRPPGAKALRMSGRPEHPSRGPERRSFIPSLIKDPL